MPKSKSRTNVISFTVHCWAVPFGETGTGGEFQALDFTHKQVKRDFAASVAAVKSVFSLKDQDDRRLIAFVYFIDNEGLLDVGPKNL
ncbi:hypothetical protein WDV93_03240 [Pantoea ananatis]